MSGVPKIKMTISGQQTVRYRQTVEMPAETYERYLAMCEGDVEALTP